ncbi:MAG: hypothetical protein CVV44_04840 [Spirochaetae bacterium HGW-Spirochaetae-1]|jgi:AcrR family transcriptional regulator|nr:MAG: hypothetical protein CVV44_04840 [Spirochaetae bacterium HGW-Spirochaetae-1]
MNKEKRQKILESAEKLFNRFGIKKTAVDDIASLAHVAKGTIYNNFGSKEGILNELLKEKIKEFEKGIEYSLQSIKDPLSRLKVILTERINILINNPFLSDGLLRINEISLKQLSQDLDRKLQQLISKIIDKDLSRISERDKGHIIDTLFYTLRGIEETIKEKFDSITREHIEQDLDYLIKRIFPAIKTKNTNYKK